jgi:hypothetical protein
MNSEKAMASFDMFENRSMERFDLELPAKVEIFGPDGDTATGALDVCTKDVCAGGAFFQADCPLPEGAPVKVVLRMPLQNLKKLTGKTAHIRVSGQVVRSSPDGFAVRFEPEYIIEPI